VATDVRQAARSDSLKSALDYSGIVATVVSLAGSRDYHLIETLASRIADRILADLGCESVRVVVRKMTPPLSTRVGYVSVEVRRPR
jgi:dihydroneopterin aldolase